jgi:hypothetical protein
LNSEVLQIFRDFFHAYFDAYFHLDRRQ